MKIILRELNNNIALHGCGVEAYQKAEESFLLFGMPREKEMMEMKKKSQKLKVQLLGAILSASISAVALTSATYAWYVSNNKVTSETSSIMAEANGFMLQIVKLGDTLDHGSDTALVSAVEGQQNQSSLNRMMQNRGGLSRKPWNADMNCCNL